MTGPSATPSFGSAPASSCSASTRTRAGWAARRPTRSPRRSRSTRSSTIPTLTTRARGRRAPRSSASSPTWTTARPSTAPATSRATSGRSEPTTPTRASSCPPRPPGPPARARSILAAMAIASPPELSTNPLKRIRSDLQVERAGRAAKLPPGPKLPSIARTELMRRDPLAVLLPAYEEHGPIFAMRIFHSLIVFMLGPEANRFILVTDRDKFRWRDGSLGDLIPLIGDGLLTTDGDFHDRAREIMMPAFHRERVAATAEVMFEEADRALDPLVPGARIDLYDWTRHVAMRVAMRALFGLDPDRAGVDVAATFESGLSFYEREYFLQVIRGPRSPFAQLRRVRHVLDRIVLDEIARRRAGGGGDDILSVLVEATDSEGQGLTDEQIRDQVLTLLFAGHDTTTSTVDFLFYERARRPEWAERIAAEHRGVADGPAPTAAELFGDMP